jgi:hypothetical protein
MRFTITITEQAPIGTLILCNMKLIDDNVELCMPNSYFVCNVKKKITQYPSWLLKKIQIISTSWSKWVINSSINKSIS